MAVGFSDGVGSCRMLSGWCRVLSGLEVSGRCQGLSGLSVCEDAYALSPNFGLSVLSVLSCCRRAVGFRVVSGGVGLSGLCREEQGERRLAVWKSSLTLWCQACTKV